MTTPSRRIAAFPLLALLVAGFSHGQEGLEMSARIWPYTSLCKFTNPPGMAGIAKRYQNVYELKLAGCEFLVGHPAAVVVTFKNRGPSTLRLEINENPRDVILLMPAGRSATAIASKADGISPRNPASEIDLFDLSYIVAETTVLGGFGYITVGGITLRELEAGTSFSLVFLFPVAHVGDTIKIGQLKPVKID